MSGLVGEIEEVGRIDAESEDQLGEFFLETDAYARIVNHKRLVVAGRKGTGKTAIYKILFQRQYEGFKNVSAVGLKFENYPWATHPADVTATPLERYVMSWTFLILVELAKLAITSPNQPPARSDTEKGCVQALERFLVTNWGEVKFTFRDLYKKKEYRFNFEPTLFDSKIGGIEVSRVPRDLLAGVLGEAIRWLKLCIGQVLHKDHSYFILFDDLDRGFNPDDPEYTARIVGLLLAARDVVNWGQEDHRQLRVAPTVFIRSDIYDQLNFPDKNKITLNLLETLRWTSETTGEDSLKTLIDQRIRAITETTAPDPWGEVFDSALMRGKQTKFKHMAARTQLRPRDMIHFVNLCITEARKGGAALIANEHIQAARPKYAAYLVKELNDEVHETYGEWKKLLDVLRRLHTVSFSRGRFEGEFRSATLAKPLTANEALELMYRFSIIGFAKYGGGGHGGSGVAFAYKDPEVGFDPVSRTFSVHPGLKEALELVDRRGQTRDGPGRPPPR
jgi:hypothetical protein